ncbi:MAG TPA: DMT family transporter [Rhodocyclaceae bacterium]|nr:DMT family transporter [Rhodocyclaceae bacterium]
MPALWMVAASFLFACMGVCVKLGADRFAAGELAFWRGFVACALLGAFVAWKRLPLATPHWRAHLWRGASGFVSLLAYFYAITLIPLATAVTLNYTSPLFLALLLAFWVREPVRPALFVALGAGFVGVVFVLQPTLGRDQWWGGFLALASGVISSVAYLNVRRLGDLGEPEWRTVFYFSALTAVGGLPWLLASHPFHAIDATGWALLLGAGGFGAAAQLCMTAAYKRGKTLTAASLAYSTVVFSSLFGMALWEDRPSLPAWVGTALIVAAGIAATALSRAGSRAAPVEQD